MTRQEYDQNKRECFVKFYKDNGIDHKVNISIFDAFDQIFDRAYALVREYAEFTDMSPVDKKNISAICECFLKFVLRRYCLVEKSKAIQIYQAKQHILANQDVFGISTATEAAAQKRLMLCLFPEIGKEVEG